jgi:hypothetical protein
MNERIKECMFSAGLNSNYVEGFDSIYSNQLEKFANLIVKECMRMCEVTEMSFVTHDCDVEASGAITVKQFIAEHFEIEE